MSGNPMRSPFTKGCCSALLVALLGGASAEAASRTYTTYLGGDSNDQVQGSAVDEAGSVYLVGRTISSSFLGQAAGNGALFVVKLTPDGQLDWVRTPGDGFGHAVAVSATSVYVGGWTDDPAFLPAGTPGWDATKDSTGRDSFVLELDRSDGSLLAGTFIQGQGNDMAKGLAAGPGGRLYVSGWTGRPDFPTTAGAFVTTHSKCPPRCSTDLYLAIFSADLGTLEYGSVFGGSRLDEEWHNPLAVDDAGRAYLAGMSESKDFPVTDGSSLGGKSDAVLAVIDPAGSGDADLVWAGYIGGGNDEGASAVRLDAFGAVWVGGRTDSSDFPGAGAANGEDGFIARLTEETGGGFAVAQSFLLGGSGTDSVLGLAVDTAGDILAAGATDSADFPVTGDADDPTANGQLDAFLARSASDGSLLHATYLGGSDEDGAGGIELYEPVGSPPRAWISGTTWSSDLPTTAGAVQEDSLSQPSTSDGLAAAYDFAPSAVCGDDGCDSAAGEDPCSCPEDCGSPADVDGDGWSECEDCDDTDTSVFPGAVEVCDNTIDDDCDGLVDGDDSDCATACGGNKVPCATDADCCSGNCRGGKCKGGGSGGGGSLAVFLRGDANDDGGIDLADSVATLNHLFAGGRPPPCADAADADDDGRISLADGVFTLAYLFSEGRTFPEPFPIVGTDPTGDGLSCGE